MCKGPSERVPGGQWGWNTVRGHVVGGEIGPV